MRKLASLVLVFLLTLGMVSSWGQSSVEVATAATTTRLVTGASITATADNVRAITHPTTSSAGVVAAANDPISIAQAAALSNLTGAALIVSASTTSATAVNTVVVQKNITKLTFVGAATVFPASFRSAIDARVTVKTAVLNNSPFERSKLLVPTSTTAFVVAKSTNIPAMEAALSYGSATDSALIVVTGSEPANSLRTYLTPFIDPKVALAGDPGVSDQLDADDSDYYAELLVDSEARTNATYDNIVQLHVDRKSRAAKKVSIAPGDDLASFALATLVGRVEKSVTIPAGTKTAITANSPANYYLGLVKAEISSLSLIGTSTTTAQLTAAAVPTTVARTAAPAWTITNTTLGTGNYAVTYTARAGASSYKVLNWDNSVLATSATTSVTLPGTPTAMILAAFDSAGNELERIYYRSNAYTVSGDRPTAITGTIQNGTANLRILGAAGVPRKIVRTQFDPYASMSAEKVPPVVVAITCNTTYTDSGLNPQFEWTYEVVNLTLKTGTGCGSSAGAQIVADGLPIGGLSLPLTDDPWAGISARGQEDLSVPRQGGAEDEPPLLPRAGQTVSDAARQLIAYNQAHPEDIISLAPSADASRDIAGSAESGAASSAASGAAAAAQAPGSGFVFSYQAYIPEAVVVGPGFSGDLSKPTIVFNGSDRAWYDVNNIHTKFDIRAYIGGTESFPTKHMGTTERFHCAVDFFRQTTSCAQVGTATASLDELELLASVNQYTTMLTFRAHASNPMEPFAQPIDGELTATLDSTSWRLAGKHDRMPVHQFWWSPLYSEGRLAYTSEDFYALYCLFPNVPGCTARVNINL
jgi:hypothetical protein